MPDETGSETARHDRIYRAARYYDIAFGYRDFAAECDFLQEVARRRLGRPAGSVIELAAGPANHAIELARRGLAAAALDREPEMVRYGREKALAAGVPLDYREGDLTGFALVRPVDLALLLLGSAACLLTNDDVIACLKRTAAALEPGGVLVLELPHPRELFGIDHVSEDAWEVTQDGIRVRVRWGAKDDRFDPIRQIAEVTTTLTIWEDGRKKVIRDRGRQRRFTVQELDALARLGGFAAVDWFGAMDLKVPLDDTDDAGRMVAVLQKA